jgi:rare lipoprotein A
MIRIASVLSLFLLLLLGGCSTRGVKRHGTLSTPYSTEKSISTTSPKKNYKHPTMRPYTVHGKRYYPTVVRTGERFQGNASWYGPDFHGKLTSNGETYNMYEMTAAHKTLPMNTVVRVTNRRNGKSTIVRVNDRGPFVATRIIDLSKKAAEEIDMVASGTAPVELEILGFEKKGSTAISDLKTLKEGPSEQVAGSFAVQIGSFRRIEGAIATQERYDSFQGYRTIIKDTEYNNERLFRVWLSGYKSEAEARDFVAQGPFKHAFIVRE